MRLEGANPARVPAIRLGERSSVGASLVAGADGVMICDPADGVTWAVPEDINDGRLPTHQGDATHDGPCVANMHVGSWGWRRDCSMTTQILVQMEIS